MLRELDTNEMKMVSGGEDEVISTGTIQPRSNNYVDPSHWTDTAIDVAQQLLENTREAFSGGSANATPAETPTADSSACQEAIALRDHAYSNLQRANDYHTRSYGMAHEDRMLAIGSVGGATLLVGYAEHSVNQNCPPGT